VGFQRETSMKSKRDLKISQNKCNALTAQLNIVEQKLEELTILTKLQENEINELKSANQQYSEKFEEYQRILQE